MESTKPRPVAKVPDIIDRKAPDLPTKNSDSSTQD